MHQIDLHDTPGSLTYTGVVPRSSRFGACFLFPPLPLALSLPD
jgi:hypothetical protein